MLLVLSLLACAARCGSGATEGTQVNSGGDAPVGTEDAGATPAGQDGTTSSPGEPPGEQDHEQVARNQVTGFLSLVREERYLEAWKSVSWMMKESYDWEDFLAVAGKLQMEEMPCIDEEDVEAMEPTEGHVGIGPKDLEVSGFLVRYACEDGEERILILYLDWSRGGISPPGGVASFWWK